MGVGTETNKQTNKNQERWIGARLWKILNSLKQIVDGDKDKSNIFQSILWKALSKSLKHILYPCCLLGLVSHRSLGISTCLICIFWYKFYVMIFPFELKKKFWGNHLSKDGLLFTLIWMFLSPAVPVFIPKPSVPLTCYFLCLHTEESQDEFPL